MSAQIMAEHWRPHPDNRADAYYVAYSATYSVDHATSVVAHEIEISAIPSWLGTTQRRYIEFDADGMLRLSSVEPIRTTSGTVSATLTWSRDGRLARVAPRVRD
jgi:hypothetical protein